MEVRPGYKMTEVGVIPKDWNVVAFQDEFRISAGGDVNPQLSSSEQDEVHPFPIYSNGLTNGGLYGYCSYSDHPAGSLTITARGTLGVANYRDHKYTAIGRVLVLEPKREFFGQFFAEFINARVNFAVESTGVPQLTAPQISGYRLAVPPLPEQRAIASALSDVDALLAGLDRLIAKKRDLKQAAMQQLLSGKTRLPGFHGDWALKQVADLGEVETGGTPSTEVDEYWGGGYPWITPTDISTYRDMSSSERALTRKGIDVVGLLPANTVLVTCIASIGKNAILTVPGACNQQINAVSPSADNDPAFLYYMFEGSKQYLQANAGITATSIISKKAFSELSFRVPELAEQSAIASILSDMDDEVEALEACRDKTRALKQGMMQELLTGRIRLV